MFGDAARPGTGSATAYNTFEELKKQWIGTSTPLNANPIPDVDDRLGFRIGQSRGIQTIRIPRVPLAIKCDNGTAMNQPLEFDLTSSVGKMVHNVTAIGIEKIHITGISGNHPNLFISLWGDNDRHSLDTSTRLMVGFSALRNKGIIIEGNTVGNEVLVTAGDSEGIFMSQFMKPHELDHLSISLQDMAGNNVIYTQMIIWLLLETEIWQ